MRRIHSLLIVLVLVATACAGSGEPDDYDTQTIDVDGREVSLIEHNFVNSCVEANSGAPDIGDPAEFCECAYLTIKNEVSFEQFRDWDDAIRDDVENPPPELARIVDGIELPCTVRDTPRPSTTVDSDEG